MTDRSSRIPMVLGPLIVGALFSGVIAFHVGYFRGVWNTEDRAVKAGAAYREVDQETGHVWIVWRRANGH